MTAIKVLAIYGPRSEAVQSASYEELTLVLETIATHQLPVFMVGDFNVRLDRPDNSNAGQLPDLIASFGFQFRETSANHQLGVAVRPSSSGVVCQQSQSAAEVCLGSVVGVPAGNLVGRCEQDGGLVGRLDRLIPVRQFARRWPVIRPRMPGRHTPGWAPQTDVRA